MWQLKKLSTGEAQNDPQPLPENWGPLFGLAGFKDKLNDLSWISKPDLGWFVVGEMEEDEISQKNSIDLQIASFLKETSEYVAADNQSVTKDERAKWIEYRSLLKEIYLQPDYPTNVDWPKRPDSE